MTETVDDNWGSVSVKKTKYPSKASPREFNISLPWKIAFEPITPPSALTEDQSVVLPAGDYKGDKHQIVIGPPESGLVVVSWGISGFFSPTKEPITTVHLVSLKHGKAITKNFPFTMKIHDISPNGKYLAVTPEPNETWPKMNNLFILRLDDGSFSPIARFTPFDDAPSVRNGDKVVIRSVHWLNNKQLFLVSEKNLGIQLDLSTQTVGFGIRPERETHCSPFALTPDRKYIVAVHDGYNSERNPEVVGMAIFNAEDGKQLGYLKLSPNRSDKADKNSLKEMLKFSPNGRLMACRGENDRIYIWDFFRGQLLGNYQGQTDGRWDWVNNRFLLIAPNHSDPFLWDAKDMTKCSKYEGNTIYDLAALGDKLVYLTSDDYWKATEYRLVYSPVIPPDINAFLANSARLKERVMGPGDTVSLQFDLRLNGSEKSSVEEHVKKQCENNGWVMTANGNADYRIVASMPAGEEIEMRLTNFGMSFEHAMATQKVRPYTMRYDISKGKQLIWATSEYVGPYRQYESKEEFTQHLTEGMREKPDWFLKQTFPKIITRGHMESEKSNATITMDGIVFGKW